MTSHNHRRGASAPGRGLSTDPAWPGWMGRALELAGRCGPTGDVPVGAVVLDSSGQEIGRGWNVREAIGDPTGHAEIVALREAATATGRWRLTGCTLVVTLEPCPMCAGAVLAARVARVVFGAWDPKAGACGSVWDLSRDRRVTHRPEVVPGVREADCRAVLAAFFTAQRAVGGSAAAL